MIPNKTKTFTRPDGTIAICATDANGKRLPTRYVKPGGEPAKTPAPTKKPPRRIEPKQRSKSAASKPPRLQSRPTFTDCIHQLGATGERTAHLCGGCPGGQFTTVCECELFGKCAPTAWAPVPDKSVRRCVDCGKYEKDIPLPPAPERE